MKLREIKFRVWHEEIKVFEYWSLISNTQPQIYEDSIVMQYTGLKDRDDEDIYGGDIVSAKRHSDYYSEGLDEWMEYDDLEIKYSMEELCLQIGSFRYHSYTWDDIKVIGNIYESPIED